MASTDQQGLPALCIEPSAIHGTGVIALHAVKKGERIIAYAGERIPATEGTQRELRTPGHTFIFSLDERWDIDGGVGGNESRLINHSCAPNTEAEVIDGTIWIIALRDIAPGEELTLDYAFDAAEAPVECRCGAPSCRGLINARASEQGTQTALCLPILSALWGV